MGKINKNKTSQTTSTNVQTSAADVLVAAAGNKIKKNKNKNRFKKPKKIDGVPTTTRLPDSAQAISSNWKNLLKTITTENQGKPIKPPAKKFIRLPKAKAMPENKVQPSKVQEAKKKPEIWFDDVDECLLDPEDRPGIDSSSTEIKTDEENSLVKERAFKGATKIIGMDCEMVGVGFNGKDSILARVSIVNHFGHCIYDKYVKPREKVTDYRTHVSGIRPKDLENGEDFKKVQKEVSDLLTNRILVGHAIKHDLKVLFLDHPRKMIRDTSTYKYFRTSFGGKTPSLKRLSERMLGVKVQEGEHSSVQDAQAAVRLYTMFRKDWERDLKNRPSKNGIQNQDIETKSGKKGLQQLPDVKTKSNNVGSQNPDLKAKTFKDKTVKKGSQNPADKNVKENLPSSKNQVISQPVVRQYYTDSD